AAAIRNDLRNGSISLAAVLFRMLARFQHQESCARSGDDTAALLALAIPDGGPSVALQIAAKLVCKQHVRMLGLEGSTYQYMARLAGADARSGGLDGRDACTFLAHERAGGASDFVDDGDVACEQVRKLREEQRRPQLGCQLLVEQNAVIFAGEGS